MDLQHVKLYAEYGTAGLYAIGLLSFWLFSLTLLKTSIKHFILCVLFGVIWPGFIAFALLRKKKANKGAPQYIEIRR